MMTALVVLESGKKLDDTIIVDGNALKFYGAGINLEIGEEVSVSDLLHGLLINSGNDAALALAIGVGGTKEKFVNLMNKKAQELRMADTHYENPHGLDAKNHFSSASDLAILASKLYKNSIVKEIIQKKEYEFDSVDGSQHHYFKTTNYLLRDDYDYMIGGKTGFTDNAGHCLTSFVSNKKENEILNVVLGNSIDQGQFHDTMAVTEWVYGNYEWE